MLHKLSLFKQAFGIPTLGHNILRASTSSADKNPSSLILRGFCHLTIQRKCKAKLLRTLRSTHSWWNYKTRQQNESLLPPQCSLGVSVSLVFFLGGSFQCSCLSRKSSLGLPGFCTTEDESALLAGTFPSKNFESSFIALTYLIPDCRPFERCTRLLWLWKTSRKYRSSPKEGRIRKE